MAACRDSRRLAHASSDVDGVDRDDSRDAHREPRSARPLSVVLAVLTLLDVLGYAPVVRLMGGWTRYATVDGFGNPATVKTPLYKPINGPTPFGGEMYALLSIVILSDTVNPPAATTVEAALTKMALGQM